MPRRLLLVLTAVLPACISTPAPSPLASATVVSDFRTYTIRRVGLVPVTGYAHGHYATDRLGEAIYAEFLASSPYRIIPLGQTEVFDSSSPSTTRAGSYPLAELAVLVGDRELDALLVPTVSDSRTTDPQRLALRLDLVACETGKTIWSACVRLDASEDQVREKIEAWLTQEPGGASGQAVRRVLESPERFARFAASQLATLL